MTFLGSSEKDNLIIFHIYGDLHFEFSRAFFLCNIFLLACSSCDYDCLDERLSDKPCSIVRCLQLTPKLMRINTIIL